MAYLALFSRGIKMCISTISRFYRYTPICLYPFFPVVVYLSISYSFVPVSSASPGLESPPPFSFFSSSSSLPPPRLQPFAHEEVCNFDYANEEGDSNDGSVDDEQTNDAF